MPSFKFLCMQDFSCLAHFLIACHCEDALQVTAVLLELSVHTAETHLLSSLVLVKCLCLYFQHPNEVLFLKRVKGLLEVLWVFFPPFLF